MSDLSHLLPCGCLPTDGNYHRGECPDWVPLSRDGDWRNWTWVRREAAPR